MPRNRVEELESTVAQLESTVEGLTEELVDAKERIRDLEAQLEPQPADGSTFEAPPEAANDDARADEERTDEHPEPTPGGEADKDEASETEDESGHDDIIVA